MDTKKLRQKILDLAIRGKLVPQDPSDEPVSVLLERIRTEKERLIKEGKIKRSKKTAADDEIEAPFEIPESWEWVRLEDFVMAITDGDHQPPPQSKTGVPFLVISDVNTGVINFSHARFVSEEYYNNLPAIRRATKGDILFTVTGSYGITILVDTEQNFCFQRHIGLIKTISCSEWIKAVLQSDCVQKYCDKVATGTAQKTVSLGHLRDLVIPVPPLSEQKRIINEIECWFTLIDELESNEGDLLKAIDKAKSKILDLAIHGKLVPQDPNDEPAIELLKRINPKFELCDEVPWELPNNWCWTTLGNISNYGKCMHVEAKDIPNDSWVLELEDLEKDTAKLLQRVTYGERDIKGGRSVFRKGDVLFSKLRTYLNKVLVAPEDGYCSTEIVPISLCDSLSSHYINHVLRSKYFVEYTTSCGYGVKMPRLSTTDACKGLIPLPPKTEQLRIVSKIEELFAVLDSIKESLEI